MSTSAIAAVLAETLAARPMFCDLLAHAQLNLERGGTLEQVRDFRLTTLGAVGGMADVLAAAMPGVTLEQAVDVIAGTTVMAASQWQTSNPPQSLAHLYAEGPALAHVASDFAPRLTRLVTLLLTGAAIADRHS